MVSSCRLQEVKSNILFNKWSISRWEIGFLMLLNEIISDMFPKISGKVPQKFRKSSNSSNGSKLHVILKFNRFEIITSLVVEILRRTKCFPILMCNRIDLAFSYLCVKSKLEKLQVHKMVAVMSHEFALV